MSNFIKSDYGVKFIDTSQDAIKEMTNLSKQALKAGGKVITKILRESVPVRTGGLKKAITAWAKIDRKTGQPYMEVGYRSRTQMKKRGVKYYVNPAWFEFGTKPHQIMTKQFKESNKSDYELKDHKTKYGVAVQHPGMTNKNFLRNTVYQNIEEIRKAQEIYLKDLEGIVFKTTGVVKLEEDEEID